MGIKIKGVVSVTHTGENGKFEYDIEDLNVSESEFLSWSDEEKENFLDDVLEGEIQNTLDAGIGWEEYEN